MELGIKGRSALICGASRGLAEHAFEAIGSTPSDFAAYIASKMERHGKIIHDANIKAE